MNTRRLPVSPLRLSPLLVPTLLVPILLVLSGLPAQGAGPATDPTRPPMAAPAATRSGPAQGAARAAARPASAVAAAAAPPPPAVPLVQSIQTQRGGAASALVDGRIVRVGDSVATGTVTAIDGDSVTVHGSNGTQRLWLLDAMTRPAAATYLATPQAAPVTAPAAAPASPSSSPAKAPVAALNGKQP